MITCAEAMASRDRRSVEVTGLVLVRHRPGSAKGVMFITIEDETGVTNLVARTMTDLSQELASVGRRGRGKRESPTAVYRVDDLPKRQPTKARDIYIPDLSLEAIRVRTRDFR